MIMHRFPQGVPSATISLIWCLIWLEARGYKGARQRALCVLLDKTPHAIDYAAQKGIERGLIHKVKREQKTVLSLDKCVLEAVNGILEKGKRAND